MKSIFKRIRNEEKPSYTSYCIVALREPSDKDSAEHFTSWIVTNSDNEIISLFLRYQMDKKTFKWIKFVKDTE